MIATRPRVRIGLISATVLLAAGLAALALGSRPSHPAPAGSALPNGDLRNTRHVGGPIDAADVSRLTVAWTLDLTAKSEFGSDSAAPVATGGVVYSQDLDSNVEAIELRTGRVLWRRSYDSPDQGPNGLVVADGEVFGATQSAAFALDQRTGRQLWSVTLVSNAHEGVDMAPGFYAGLVYVSTVPGTVQQYYGAGGHGVLWALDARTGRPRWHFDTVSAGLWPPGGPAVNSGGGLWYTPAFDGHGGIYIGTGNPAPFPGTESAPWGSSRPGSDLYTDSVVKLDAATGKLDWYYQLTPHDVHDWDLQDPPVLVRAGGRDLVIGAGKAGIVIALDARSGALVWRRAVGTHDGHDDDGLHAMRHEYGRLKTPMTVYPGLLGGVIAPMATDGSRLFVPVVDHAVTISSQGRSVESEAGTGELIAIDLADGRIAWDRKLPAPLFGAVTSVNDVVFVPTFAGQLLAFGARDGRLLWQARLPAGANTGVTVSGSNVLAPAGVSLGGSRSPALVDFRLPPAGGQG